MNSNGFCHFRNCRNRSLTQLTGIISAEKTVITEKDIRQVQVPGSLCFGLGVCKIFSLCFPPVIVYCCAKSTDVLDLLNGLSISDFISDDIGKTKKEKVKEARKNAKVHCRQQSKDIRHGKVTPQKKKATSTSVGTIVLQERSLHIGPFYACSLFLNNRLPSVDQETLNMKPTWIVQARMPHLEIS